MNATLYEVTRAFSDFFMEKSTRNHQAHVRVFTTFIRSGFKGAGVWTPSSPPLRDSTPCRPKGSHLRTNLRYPFLPDGPKNLQKEHSAPIFNNFEARAEKWRFFG